MSDFHALTRNIRYKGSIYALFTRFSLIKSDTTVQIQRSGRSGKLPCPCGNPNHARHNFQDLYSLCRKIPHPDEPNTFPADVVRGLLSSGPEGPLNNTPKPLDLVKAPDPLASAVPLAEPMVIDEASFPDEPLASTEGLSKACPEHVTLETMDVDPEASDLGHSHDMDSFPSSMDTVPSYLEVDWTARATSIACQPSPVPDPSVSQRLLSWGLQVDPRFRLTICIWCQSPVPYRYAHGHLLSSHKLPSHAQRSTPTAAELEEMLVSLGADQALSVFPGPISPIPGVAIVDALKCTIAGCQSLVVFSDQRRFREHCQRDHPNLHRSKSSVKAHALGKFCGLRQMVELTDAPPSSFVPLFNKVQEYIEAKQLHKLSDVFQPTVNARLKGTIFAQVGWDQLLVGVNIRDLRDTVVTPTAADVAYHRLTQAVERYYASLPPLISSLPILTARAVLSTGELGSQPFKPVQESATLKKYSRLVALFLVFLLRHRANPIPEFSVPFHPLHIEQLYSLRVLLDAEEPSGLQEKIHSTLISLLTHLSHEATLTDRKDLLTLFLVAYHLRDNAGNMTKASALPPNISAVQWCLRATAVGELLQKAHLHGGDTFK